MNENTKIHCLFEVAKLSRFFAPKIVAELNDHFIKVVKIKGDKVPWHNHDNSDELFYVLDGELTMEIESQPASTIKVGELFVVKKNIEHRVSSKEECKLLLIEHKETAHTGNVKAIITKSIDEQIKES